MVTPSSSINCWLEADVLQCAWNWRSSDASIMRAASSFELPPPIVTRQAVAAIVFCPSRKEWS
eukprot:6194064-Pleurochrysis_carterae.AAC.2